ncbi:hypothetical protein DERF_001859 [Dermatophagoides farinae]|uniref:Uncharacterized protein n=1 Tax=Dermatophagoides farinae TaxID=6954 RepID=A0A922IFN7_DERFA|nr:hypothetical protein DERF_001859 [Dermatophagoides farinae]
MYQQFYETVYQIIQQQQQQQKNKPRTNWGVISSTLSLIVLIVLLPFKVNCNCIIIKLLVDSRGNNGFILKASNFYPEIRRYFEEIFCFVSFDMYSV